MSSTAITDPKIMGDFFQTHLSIFPGATGIENLRIEQHDRSLIFDPRIVLVEYSLTLKRPEGDERIVIRGSTDPSGKRQKAHKILEYLCKRGFDRGPFIVPQTLGYYPEFDLLLYKNFAGESLMNKIQHKPGVPIEQIFGAVKWLAKYHEISGDLRISAGGAENEKDHFIKSAEGLAKSHPASGERIRKIVEKINLASNDPGETGDRIVHGDFQPNNIIFGDFPPQTAVIDFNDAFYCDELYDLAYFLTQTRFMIMAYQSRDIAPELLSVRDWYLQTRGLKTNPGIIKKLNAYSAKTLLYIRSVRVDLPLEPFLEDIESLVANAQ